MLKHKLYIKWLDVYIYMPNIISWLPKSDYQELEKQCELLNESIYEYTQKAVKERLRQNAGLVQKAYDWLWNPR